MRTMILFFTIIMNINCALYSQNTIQTNSSLEALRFAGSVQRSVNEACRKNNNSRPFDMIQYNNTCDGADEVQWKLSLNYNDQKLTSYIKTSKTNNSISEKTTFLYNDHGQITNISMYYLYLSLIHI